MKPFITTLCCTALLIGWVFSQIPQKAPLSRYSGLWQDSPFTSKPPPPEAGPLVNPLEDFVLLGVSPIRGGYRVTMMDKKATDKRITVDSDNQSSNYKILGVSRTPGDPLGTSVQMSIGSKSGTIRYDEKTLVLAAAAPPNPVAPPGQPPMPVVQPQPIPDGQQPVRQPRPRVVPPPAPAANGQPDAQQQMPQGQPTQPQNQRPQRRAN